MQLEDDVIRGPHDSLRVSKEFLKFCRCEVFLVPETSHFWSIIVVVESKAEALIWIDFGMSSQETLHDFGIYMDLPECEFGSATEMESSWFFMVLDSKNVWFYRASLKSGCSHFMDCQNGYLGLHIRELAPI